MQSILLITILFIILFYIFETKFVTLSMFLGYNLIRLRIVIENMVVHPKTGWIQRFIGDYLRCLAVPFCKMLIMGKIQYCELFKMTPSILTVMALVYIPTFLNVKKYYKDQS